MKERYGLYLVVFCGMVASCQANHKLDRIELDCKSKVVTIVHTQEPYPKSLPRRPE